MQILGYREPDSKFRSNPFATVDGTASTSQLGYALGKCDVSCLNRMKCFDFLPFHNIILSLIHPVSTDVQLGHRRCLHVDEILIERGRCPSISQHLPPVTFTIRRLRPRQFAIRSQSVEPRLCRYAR